jgi:hypothetical protein
MKILGVILTVLILMSCKSKDLTKDFIECYGYEEYKSIHDASALLDSLVLDKFETDELKDGYQMLGTLFIESQRNIEPTFTTDLLSEINNKYDVTVLYDEKSLKKGKNYLMVSDFTDCLIKVDSLKSKDQAAYIHSIGQFHINRAMDLFYYVDELEDDFYFEMAKIFYIQSLYNHYGPIEKSSLTE